jgi:hypothetical protein
VKLDLKIVGWLARLTEMPVEQLVMLVAKLVVSIEKLAAKLAGWPGMHSDLPVGNRPEVPVWHFEDEALEEV